MGGDIKVHEEDAEELGSLIRELRGLVETDTQLHVRTDDAFMLRYLRCSEYEPNLAFQKMKNYYTCKLQNPDWYSTTADLTPHLYNISRHSHFIMRDRDPSGKRVYIIRVAKIDANNTTMSMISQLNDLFIESVLEEEETQKNGIAIIVDMKGYSFSLLRWLTPNNVRVATKKAESLPFKKLEYHIVNTSPLVNASLKIILPLLSQKTRNNIHFHFDNLPSLHALISPDILPAEYGGLIQDLNIDKLIEKQLTKNSKSMTETLGLGYEQSQ